MNVEYRWAEWLCGCLKLSEKQRSYRRDVLYTHCSSFPCTFLFFFGLSSSLCSSCSSSAEVILGFLVVVFLLLLVVARWSETRNNVKFCRQRAAGNNGVAGASVNSAAVNTPFSVTGTMIRFQMNSIPFSYEATGTLPYPLLLIAFLCADGRSDSSRTK